MFRFLQRIWLANKYVNWIDVKMQNNKMNFNERAK